MKPEPTPVDGTENGLRSLLPADSLVMVTTAGLTRAATLTMASELFVSAELDPVDVCVAVVDDTAGALAGFTRATVATDAADAESMDAPSAAARMNRVPRCRGAVDAATGGVGADDEAKASGDGGSGSTTRDGSCPPRPGPGAGWGKKRMPAGVPRGLR